MARRLNREWSGAHVRVHALAEYYRVTDTQYRQALKSRGFTDAEIGTHAGVADTSLALAVDPRLVRGAQLAAGSSLDAAHGVYGDPRRASAEAGAVGAFILLRAFASGSSALTGVEAIANGVNAFRRPQSSNAAKTLLMMASVAIVLFLGVSYLAVQVDARPSSSVW